MEIREYIGKVVQVRILEKKKRCYMASTIKENYPVYIEDTGDYEEEELIDAIEKCIIIEEKQGRLIGFLLTNRKFIHDVQKINQQLKYTSEYSKIKDIYLMERLKINGKVMGLYLVDEGDIGKYYLDTQEIGTYIKKLRQNNILFKENTVRNEIAKQIKDIVRSIDLTKKEVSLREEQEREKNLIEKALGIESEEGILGIVTLDLKQKVREEQEKNNRRIREKNKKRKTFQEPKRSTIKDVNIKQEMDTKDKVTDMKTLGKLLRDNGQLPQIKGKHFTKIGIIESDQRDNLIDSKGKKAKVNTTRYAFVAIATDGTVVPLDIEQDHTEGNNPRESNYQVSQNGRIEKDDVLSRYKIGQGTFAVKNGRYGEIKVYHSPRKTIGGNGVEGNKSLDRELETNNIWEIKKEERDLAEDYGDGYRSVEESYQEAKLHEDKAGRMIGKEKMRVEDIDGEKNTKSHVHDNVNYNTLAVKWGYYKEGQPNAEKAKELFEEKRRENPKRETKEIIEMVTEELEEEIGHSRDSRY